MGTNEVEIGTGEVEAPRVRAGWQTWAGYLLSVAGFAVALALDPATALNLPDEVQVALVAVAGALAAVTGKNRSDQAVELTRARAEVAIAAPALPVIPAEPAVPVGIGSVGELNVELDGLPSELHGPELGPRPEEGPSGPTPAAAHKPSIHGGP